MAKYPNRTSKNSWILSIKWCFETTRIDVGDNTIKGETMNIKTTTSSGRERRRYIRIESTEVLDCQMFNSNALLDGGAGERIRAVAKNISAGGVLFESHIKYDIGNLLKLDIDLPGWEKFKAEFYKYDEVTHTEPLVILATVVRVEVLKPEKLYDIGVCFSAIDEGHRWALLKYITRSRSDR